MLDHRLLPEQPPKPTPQSASPGHFSREEEEPWERFLAMVQKTNLSLYFALKSGQLYDRPPRTLTFDNPEWAAGFISGIVYVRHLVDTLRSISAAIPADKLLESLDGALGVLEKAKPKE